MANRTLSLEVAEELVELLGSPEATAARAKQALVLELLRESRISQGRAARLLGISRWETLDLMARHDIESGPETVQEMLHDIEVVRRTVSGDA